MDHKHNSINNSANNPSSGTLLTICKCIDQQLEYKNGFWICPKCKTKYPAQHNTTITGTTQHNTTTQHNIILPKDLKEDLEIFFIRRNYFEKLSKGDK